jgi:hypothetical protein
LRIEPKQPNGVFPDIGVNTENCPRTYRETSKRPRCTGDVIPYPTNVYDYRVAIYLDYFSLQPTNHAPISFVVLFGLGFGRDLPM